MVLHPGRTFGALEFLHELRSRDCSADVTVAEAATFLFAARSSGPVHSRIMRIKHAVRVAAIPSARTDAVIASLSPWYEQFTAAESTLATSFGNVGAVVHPAITLLNAARIENSRGRFDFYIDGVSPGPRSRCCRPGAPGRSPAPRRLSTLYEGLAGLGLSR